MNRSNGEPTETRPWGRFYVLDEGAGFKVKRIVVRPQGRLSLQSHRHRWEHWTVICGEATVTVVETGEQYHLTPGTIMCHPKGLELLWETKAPYFKKYWVIFDSPKDAPNPPKELTLANINDNPDEWIPLSWEEAEGPQDCGELFFIKQTGTTGTHMAGIWRSGIGIHGCDEKGVSKIPYTAPLG